MNWKPTTRQLETLAELAIARAPVAVMAAALGLTPEAFVAWRRRSLAAARAEEERYKPEPIPEPKPVVAPVSPRIVAERLFEGDPAADGMLRP